MTGDSSQDGVAPPQVQPVPRGPASAGRAFTDHPSHATSKPQLSARFDGLVDLVEDEGRVLFLYWKEGELLSSDEVVLADGTRAVPPPRRAIPYLLPRLKAVEQAIADWNDASACRLFEDIRAAIARWAVLPEPQDDWLDLLGVWVLHTYVQEFITHSPIVYLYGVAGRGKSRLGKVLAFSAYRGVRTPSIRQATCSRLAEGFAATVFFDVFDISQARWNEAQDLLLNRFEKGSVLPRTINPQAGLYEDTIYLRLFGPTVIATNFPADQTLRTRCISVVMPDCSDAPSVKGPHPEEAELLPMRERLVAWRALLLGSSRLPEAVQVADGRLGDITLPLVQVTMLVAPGRLQRLVEHISRIADEGREERAASLEARVVAALHSLADQVHHGRVPLSILKRRVEEVDEDSRPISRQALAGKLRELGLRTTLIQGRTEVHYDEGAVERLVRRWCNTEVQQK